MRKSLCVGVMVIAVAVLAGTLAFGARAPDAQEMVIAMHNTREDTIVWGIAERIKEQIEEGTDGRIRVTLVGPEVGGERDMLEGTAANEYQMVQSGDMILATYAPRYSVTAVPFVIPDYDTVDMVYEGEIGRLMNEALIQNGSMRLLGTSLRGARLLTANRPIRHPDEMDGLRLRVPEIDTWVMSWEQVGARATPVAWPEVFSALQTGVVDAQENPIAQIQEASLYEVQDYIIMTEHLLAYFHWAINEDFYQSLDPADREVVETAVRNATSWGTAQQESVSQRQLDAMVRDHGIQIVEPDRDAFFERARPAIQRIAENDWAPEVQALLVDILGW